jgi:DNA polymerase-1
MGDKITVHIIDTSWLLHKSYHAFNHLQVNGTPTGHLYGALKYLEQLKNEDNNCMIIFAIDGVDKEREKTMEDYKANRSHKFKPNSTNPDLMKLIGGYENVYSAFNWQREADDVIYSLAAKFSKEKNVNCYIHSTDKDMFQSLALGENIKIIRKLNNPREEITVEYVIGEYNVNPKNWAIYRALTGDPSDNIKGYPRINRAAAAYMSDNYVFTDTEVMPGEGMSIERENNAVKKWFIEVNRDFALFKRNLSIIRAKKCDYELTARVSDDKIIYETCTKYKLNQYLTNLQSYREKLKRGE